MTLSLPTPEVPVPNRFNMADLTAALLAPGTPQEAQQEPEPTLTPQDSLQPQGARPERRRAYHRSRGAGLPSRQEREEGRRLAAEYRAYAEAWYQALWDWEVRQPTIPTPKLSLAVLRGYEPISTLGEMGPDLPTALATPLGELREVEVAREISYMVISPVPDRHAAGMLLERVRSGKSAPVSLLRETGGWASPAPRMAGYAAAVLTLAVTLGDEGAEAPLRYAQAVMRRAEGGEDSH